MMSRFDIRFFRRISLYTLGTVYFLILVGGIVRSTGSGMGCPDWPKCFGRWVPPTDVSELPENYKEHYSEYRHQKNLRLASYLQVLGMEKRANRLLTDERIREEGDFNAAKTWTEYINRLIGAAVGLLILGTAAMAALHIKKDRLSFIVAFATLVLVIFQGWLGSVVVSTNLLGWTVTAHMIMALVIVLLLIFLNYRLQSPAAVAFGPGRQRTLQILLIAGMLVLAVQIVLGTRVREAIDVLSTELARQDWVAGAGTIFPVHRSFSLLVLALNGWVVLLLLRHAPGNPRIFRTAIAFTAIVLLQVVTGVVMAYFALPPAVQPLHLLLGLLGFGLIYYLYLIVHNSSVRNSVKVS
jgi:heme a synthase